MKRVIMFLWLVWQAAAAQHPLIGTWTAQTEEGGVRLQFVSKTSLIYNGQTYACSIDGRTIYVQDEYGTTPYPYALEGKKLRITFPEGDVYTFAPVRENTQQVTPKPQPSGTQNHLLQGKYCSYSGSSGSGGSYASSNWAWFDGAGTFRYGSGAYYTGYGANAGDVYGNERGGDVGSYTVEGNTLTLHLPDGSRVQARIFERAQNGRVTGFQYGKLLYSPGLCD